MKQSLRSPLRGSTEICPKCGSRSVFVFDVEEICAFDADLAEKMAGHGPTMARCNNCSALWEPFNPTEIWDKDDPFASFKEPCNNCAFRPGSNEQQDREKWRLLISQLRAGGSFYCHKGVPLAPGTEDGFAYPRRKITSRVGDDVITTKIPDQGRLRFCRGYLNALTGLRKRPAGETNEENIDV